MLVAIIASIENTTIDVNQAIPIDNRVMTNLFLKKGTLVLFFFLDNKSLTVI